MCFINLVNTVKKSYGVALYDNNIVKAIKAKTKLTVFTKYTI